MSAASARARRSLLLTHGLTPELDNSPDSEDDSLTGLSDWDADFKRGVGPPSVSSEEDNAGSQLHAVLQLEHDPAKERGASAESAFASAAANAATSSAVAHTMDCGVRGLVEVVESFDLDLSREICTKQPQESTRRPTRIKFGSTRSKKAPLKTNHEHGLGLQYVLKVGQLPTYNFSVSCLLDAVYMSSTLIILMRHKCCAV